MTIETCKKFLDLYKAKLEDEKLSSAQRIQLKKNMEMMVKHIEERGYAVEAEPVLDAKPEVDEVVEDGDD